MAGVAGAVPPALQKVDSYRLWKASKTGLWLEGGRRTDGPLWPSVEFSRLVMTVAEILFRYVCPQLCYIRIYMCYVLITLHGGS